MHLLRQILLLKQQGKSIRDIARSLAIARNTIRGYLRLLPQTDLTALLSQTDAQLNLLIQPPPAGPLVGSRLAELQKRLPVIDRQLACTGVTRYDLWLAYRGEQPKGYQYTQFCHHYRQWRQTQQLTMHFEHKAGDKVFVDFAGKRLSLVDEISGEVKSVEFFVAVLGCSQLTYAQAITSQRTEDFIEALQNALCYFGGVPAAIVPDNLKAAVIRPIAMNPRLTRC
ncbi:hypothetical protein GCM10028807_09030 [Spirosoma daeguense]